MLTSQKLVCIEVRENKSGQPKCRLYDSDLRTVAKMVAADLGKTTFRVRWKRPGAGVYQGVGYQFCLLVYNDAVGGSVGVLSILNDSW